jgi:hypothetical protein
MLKRVLSAAVSSLRTGEPEVLAPGCCSDPLLVARFHAFEAHSLDRDGARIGDLSFKAGSGQEIELPGVLLCNAAVGFQHWGIFLCVPPHSPVLFSTRSHRTALQLTAPYYSRPANTPRSTAGIVSRMMSAPAAVARPRYGISTATRGSANLNRIDRPSMKRLVLLSDMVDNSVSAL